MVRTQEQLQKLFQQSRERHQADRERKKQLRIQSYKELCKQADDLLKQAEQQVKDRLMEQLQALAPKTPQKPLKCTVTEFYISHNRYIEKDNDGLHYYQTREELKQAEERGEGKINWTKFDQLVNKVRKELGL